MHPLHFYYKSTSAQMMETAIKHTRVAESNLSPAICTANNHCNRVFAESQKIGLEGNPKALHPFPAPGRAVACLHTPDTSSFLGGF